MLMTPISRRCRNVSEASSLQPVSSTLVFTGMTPPAMMRSKCE